MTRREILKAGAGLLVLGTAGGATAGQTFAGEWALPDFHAARRFADTAFGRIAYVERGSGPAALFLHGWPLNGFHWRGGMAGLAGLRRCIAPDFMGLGHSEVPEEADLAPAAQAGMIVALMDRLDIPAADIVANDSATAIAQLLAVRHPGRVRSLLLTNGDVHTNSPPPGLQPAIEQARRGELIHWFDRQVADPAFAATREGLGLTYTDPAFFDATLVEAYLAPLVGSPARRRQCQQYGVAFEPNPLPAIETDLRRLSMPARIVWGTGDPLFPSEWAHWLDEALPGVRGVRFVPDANLFFPEEFPEIIVDEARRLWSGG